MLTTLSLEAMALGALGALMHEAARWVGLRQASRLPAYFYRLHYWLLSIVLVVLGGLLAALLDAKTVAQALAIGVSAPAIISRLGAAAPKELNLGKAHDQMTVDAPKEGDDDGIQHWFRG